MSSSALTTTSALPHLPPELIDEILRESELSNSDLAQCCLVSHQFLPSARRSLYSKVEILLHFRHTAYITFGWNYLHSTRKLWRTLEENPSLRKLCHRLLLEDRLDTNWINLEKVARDPEQITLEWLDLLEGVRDLSTATCSYRDTVSAERRWNTLHIGLDSPGRSIQASLQASGVKKLKLFPDLYGWAHEEFAIPPAVITFDSSALGDWKLLPTKHPQLRNLSINLHQANSINLVAFPDLVYLSISGDGVYKIKLKRLPDLIGLRRLSLNFELDGSEEGFDSSDSLQSFLSNLPSSVYRLNFRKRVPFTILNSILNGNDFSITQLGFSEWVNLSLVQRLEGILLKDTCRRMGIELYNLEKEDPVFAF